MVRKDYEASLGLARAGGDRGHGPLDWAQLRYDSAGVEMMDWSTVKFFRREEFACPCGACGGPPVEPQEALVKDLELIREAWGEPIHITSGVRCAAHNKAVGGAPDSAHLTGWAVDVSITDSVARYEFMTFAIHTFHRIGLGETLYHLDRDPSRPARVLWLYKGK